MNQPDRGVIGIGEPPTVSTAAAIGNAVNNAIGLRVRSLPITPNGSSTRLQRRNAREGRCEGLCLRECHQREGGRGGALDRAREVLPLAGGMD